MTSRLQLSFERGMTHSEQIAEALDVVSEKE